MKKLFLVSFLILNSAYALSKKTPTIKYASHVKPFLQQTTANELMDLLRQLVKEGKPMRIPGESGHEKAQLYLQNKIKEFDAAGSGELIIDKFNPDIEHAIHFYEQDFKEKVEGKFAKESSEYKHWLKFTNAVISATKKFKGVAGTNIIWSKKGKIRPDSYIVIGAHYDTIGMDKKTNLPVLKGDFPGADYNASGVAIQLALIKNLAQLELNKTVVVVFFDYQGPGFLGSHQFVSEFPKKYLQGKRPDIMINLEMLGNDTITEDKEKKSGNMRAYLNKEGNSTYSAEQSWYEACGKSTTRAGYGINFAAIANGFEFSDNISFWAQNIPAITFSQNWENDFNQKRYQSQNDFPETINQKTLYQSYQYIGHCVLVDLLELKV